MVRGRTRAGRHPGARELNAIPEKQLIQNQRAISLDPIVVLLTFNKHETQAVREHFCPKPRTVIRDSITYNDLGLHGGCGCGASGQRAKAG